MRVLAVDDNIERMMHIHSIMPDYCQFEYVISKKDALIKLSNEFYDLVIIDVIIPEDSKGSAINSSSGRSLIEAIISSQRVFHPFQIVGVTVEEESYKANCDFFEERLIPFLLYNKEPDGDKALLNLIARVNKISEIHTKKVDAVIITAVEDEYKEVLKMPMGWRAYQSMNSIENYQQGEILVKNGEKKSVILLKLNEMGLVSAARQTECILNEFHPHIVCMCGICAGINGKVNKGDLIVAEKSWDYGNGKILPGGESGYYYNFDAEPNQIQLNAKILSSIREFCDKCLQQANDSWNMCHSKKEISTLRIGALPSGAAVVQDERLIKSIVMTQHRKCLGIDMETYAVYYACHCNKRNPDFLSMKAVVDFADSSKDDEYHEYASYISAHVLVNFLKEYFQEES